VTLGCRVFRSCGVTNLVNATVPFKLALLAPSSSESEWRCTSILAEEKSISHHIALHMIQTTLQTSYVRLRNSEVYFVLCQGFFQKVELLSIRSQLLAPLHTYFCLSARCSSCLCSLQQSHKALLLNCLSLWRGFVPKIKSLVWEVGHLVIFRAKSCSINQILTRNNTVP
jgi:hypothetical protein